MPFLGFGDFFQLPQVLSLDGAQLVGGPPVGDVVGFQRFNARQANPSNQSNPVIDRPSCSMPVADNELTMGIVFVESKMAGVAGGAVMSAVPTMT